MEKDSLDSPSTEMNRVYVVMLCLVELMAFSTNCYELATSHETRMSVAFNQTPVSFNNSQGAYKCFMNISECTYEHPILHFLKLAHVIFIAITIIAYIVIFITLHSEWEKSSPKCIGITYLGIAKAVVMLMLVINTVILFVTFFIKSNQKWYSLFSLHTLTMRDEL